MSRKVDLRERTSAVLEKHGIPVHPNLPYINEHATKDVQTVGQRVVALYALTGLANGADVELVKTWLKTENMWHVLGSQEQTLFDRSKLAPSVLNELSWKQESLYALCWTLGLLEELSWPDKEADLTAAFRLIPPEMETSNFFESLHLRPEIEILQQLDIYYCLHAASKHPELWGNTNLYERLLVPAVVERRLALEWICDEEPCWNKLSLNT